uniref:Uncharacterized protein n=1 Tax=Arundo donax TaxID=35708 RepID=A0A0A8YYQ3_ARUDO
MQTKEAWRARHTRLGIFQQGSALKMAMVRVEGRTEAMGRYFHPCDATDKQLFRASTQVQLGDGTKAKFWHDCWLNGKAPMDIVPDLYKLSWRKNKTVKEGLQNHKWTQGLMRMSTAE